MQIKLSQEQIMLRDMVREFTEKEIAPRDKWMDENGFDRELFEKMKEAGFFTIPLPREYGGAGCDFVSNTMVIHEVAKGSASIALFLDSAWLGADMILVNGNDEQKKKYLSEAAAGKLICFALTEPSGGSDAAALKSTAVKNADGNWVLCGSKSWITNIDADYYVIMAKTDPAAGSRGISTFIVPRGAEGFSVITRIKWVFADRRPASCSMTMSFCLPTLSSASSAWASNTRWRLLTALVCQ